MTAIAVRIRHTPPDPDALARLRARICESLDEQHGPQAVDKLLAVAAYASASASQIVGAYAADTAAKITDEPLLDWLDSGALGPALRRQQDRAAADEACMDITAVREVARAGARLVGAWNDPEAPKEQAWRRLRAAIDCLDERFCDRIARVDAVEHLGDSAGHDGPTRFAAHLEYTTKTTMYTVMLHRCTWHMSDQGWVLTGLVNASWLDTPDFSALHRFERGGRFIVGYPDNQVECIELAERPRVGWRRADGTVDLSFLSSRAPIWSPS